MCGTLSQLAVVPASLCYDAWYVWQWETVPEAYVREGVFRSTAFHLQTVLLTFDPCSYLHPYLSPSSSAAGNSLPLIGFCSRLGKGG